MSDSPNSTPPAWYLAGPTAVGKSALALALAERLNGEIISVDSMQVYRGLDVGTAKPSGAEQARVPHHLIDVLDLADAFDAARFVALAKAAETEIRRRGRLPIYCGGTGLYFKALLCGLGEAPAADPALRAELERTSLAALLVELGRRDPQTFARIDRQNPRRIIRALEVIRATNRPLGEQQASWRGSPAVPEHFIAFARETNDLRHRIDARVDRMFTEGLVDETRRLLGAGLAENRTAMQAIGYRQVTEHLRGERSLADTIRLVKGKTWQLARRQQTWLRHQLPATWTNLQPTDDAEKVASALLAGKVS